jgi:hypothetical protein
LIGSQSLLEVDLTGVKNRGEFRQAIEQHLEQLEPGQWLVGGYWNDEHWEEESGPDKSWIEDLTGDRPAILYRHDLHQSLCNTAALRAAGFSDESANPPGGTLGRDSQGKLNGLVFEKAMTLVRQQIPEPPLEQIHKALAAGIAHANSLGITAATDMIDDVRVIEHYRSFCGEEHRGCRFELCAPLPQRQELFAAGYQPQQQFGHVRLGPLKGFMDGSLGSRTAYMRQPYDDDAGNRGYLLDMANPPEKMYAMISESARRGFASTVHAIGTEAVSILLDLFAMQKQSGYGHGLRHRVEHAQHILDQDIPRFTRNGLIVSMQPTHLVDDGNYARAALGKEREHTSYRFNSLLKAGATLTFNTDWPVVELNPLTGIHAAVTRRTSDGKHPEGWLPEEKVTVQQAVHAYTAAAAYACGQEKEYGRLQPGWIADLAVLDRNIFTCEPEEIESASVILTMADGRVVFEKQEQ